MYSIRSLLYIWVSTYWVKQKFKWKPQIFVVRKIKARSITVKMVTRWLNEFRSGCKSSTIRQSDVGLKQEFRDHVPSNKSKSGDYLEIILRLSWELSIFQSSVVFQFHNLSFGTSELCFPLRKYCKTSHSL